MREYLKKAAPRAPESDEAVRVVVAEILGAVRREGDAAVRRYSEKLDRWSPAAFRLSPGEIVTYQRLSRAASARVAPIAARICEIEGMLAHKATADLRERRYAVRQGEP